MLRFFRAKKSRPASKCTSEAEFEESSGSTGIEPRSRGRDGNVNPGERGCLAELHW